MVVELKFFGRRDRREDDTIVTAAPFDIQIPRSVDIYNIVAVTGIDRIVGNRIDCEDVIAPTTENSVGAGPHVDLLGHVGTNKPVITGTAQILNAAGGTATEGIIPGPGIYHAACTCASDDKTVVTRTAVKIKPGPDIRPHINKIIVPGMNQDILPTFLIIRILIFIVVGIDRVHAAKGFFLTQGIYRHRARVIFIAFNTVFLLGDIFIVLTAGHTKITHMQVQRIINLRSNHRCRSPAPGLAGGDTDTDNGHLNIRSNTGFGDFQGRIKTGQGFMDFKKAQVDAQRQVAVNPAVNHQPASGAVRVMQLCAGLYIGKFKLNATV